MALSSLSFSSLLMLLLFVLMGEDEEEDKCSITSTGNLQSDRCPLSEKKRGETRRGSTVQVKNAHKIIRAFTPDAIHNGPPPF